ncbi:APC family permease [Zhenpiania hominis]|uniref:APC family permease n=1 Tax=Zhenpiania hominis TaxID=2763644 RepID=UPI0039F536A3
MEKQQKLSDNNGQVKLKGNMGVGALVMAVLAFSAPLSTATGFIPQLLIYGSADNGNGNSAPWIYIICLITLGFFSVGFAKMGTVMERPGGFYAYITDALGKKVGLAAALISAIGYSLVGFFMPGLMAITVGALVEDAGGPEIPWWIYGLIFAVLSTLLASMSIDFSAKFLFIVMCFEAAIMLVFDALCFINGSPAGSGGAGFSFIDLSTGTLGIAMLFAMGNFYGFEATVVYREEVKEPKKTIPRATFIAVIGIGVFYLLCAWGFIAHFGSAKVTAAAEAETANLFSNVLTDFMGPFAGHLIQIIALVSIFASGLAIQNVGARYFYSLGVDGVIPKIFGKVHPKQNSPYVAAIAIGVLWVALIVILGMICGFDAAYTYTRPNVIGNLFVTAILGTVAVAVLVYMRKNAKKYGFTAFQTTIAPIIGLLGIGFTVVLCAINLNTFLGTTTIGSVLIIALFVVVAAFGVIYATWLQKNKPETYLRIGRYDPENMSVDEMENMAK